MLPPSSVLSSLFSYIDEHKHQYIQNLREAVAIQSVSGNSENRKDVNKMIEWTSNRLKSLGCKVDLKHIGFDDKGLSLPDVIMASLGDDPNKRTVCIYGHIDVQPASLEDGWASPPFELTERDGKLYGRGATDDKGPVLCWFHALEAFQATGKIPVNVKFVLESMEECGSKGLEELLIAEKQFFDNVDYVCISDNYWLGTERPTLTYALRGICYFHVEVEGAALDLHSGIYGGTVQEAMEDLIYLLGNLSDKNGKIAITNFYDNVAPLTDDEYDLYKNILFDVDEYRNSIGCKKLLYNEDKVQILMHRWRHPCLSIHGIEGAFSEHGSKTVIPRKVIGKFSIRFVPNQSSKEIEKLVVSYLEQKFKERKSLNNLKVFMTGFGDLWSEDPFHPNYVAGSRATKHVYGVEPDLIRDGGTIPILLIIQKVTGKNILLLPVGQGDDGAHSQNEKVNVKNYIEGTKLLGAYLYEVSQID
ncbi:hypothetical protein RN001_010100 [Aquatica leii]|uniref:Peptidase M20 dimerisation domain-containing protein n=1 Tax=Aquatica leii TaxID=1421715 RepID=A0AAN7PUF2_9COLE|nr:hypothetical protein RN001_010100 [Aquatica leii]